MGLQLDWGAIELFVERLADVARLAFQFEVVLHQNSVEEYRHVGGRFYRAVLVEDWGGPGYVVDLPFAGLAVGVSERDRLFVDAPGLSVDVSLVVVVVEHLEFVSGVLRAGGGEEDPAVAAGLACAGYVLRNSPLNVELVVSEGTFGLDVARGLAYQHGAVGDGPLGGGVAVLGGDPLVEIFAVEENDRVGGRGGWRRAGSDHFGFWLPDFRVFRLGGGLLLG